MRRAGVRRATGLRAAPRVAAGCAAAALAFGGAMRAAGAAEHEVYGLAGAGYFGGVASVVVGAGPGVGYRIYVVPGLSFHAEQRWLLYGGNAFTTSVGGDYAFVWRSWTPSIGLQVTGYYGDQIRVVDGASPDPPPPFNAALQVRVAPLRFRVGRYSASALVLDYGYSLERGTPAMAFSVAFLEVGVRF